jgi:hypothetical protein
VPRQSLDQSTGGTTSSDTYSYLTGDPSASTELAVSPPEDESADKQAKPRCWDHGCNGREFSSKSNFMRHIKERSGASAKPICPLCGAVFARNSGRDRHLAKQSCNRIRRYSNGRPRPSRLALLGNPNYVASDNPQDAYWPEDDGRYRSRSDASTR